MGGGSRLRLPPPRQPLPHGAILHRYTAREEITSLRRQREHPAKDPFHAPSARLSGLSPRTARPLEGGRPEAAERPGGGGDPAREVFSDTSRQGRGEPSPPPPSPSAPPPRGDSPSIHCPGVHPHTRFPVINSPKILSLPSCTAIQGQSPRTARRPGRAGRRPCLAAGMQETYERDTPAAIHCQRGSTLSRRPDGQNPP